MSQTSALLKMYRKAAGKPGGTTLFSKAVAFKAPFFRSISPTISELEPGRCVVTIKKRWGVTNHIGTVHAIAMCNMAELAGGLMTDVSIPSSMRWIPKGMTVQYLKKAETNLTATATPTVEPVEGKSMDYPVEVSVTDTNGQEVFHAKITMYLSPKG